MKELVLCLAVAAVLFVTVGSSQDGSIETEKEIDLHRSKRSWSWSWRRCPRYDPDTQYCCRPRWYRRCCRRDLHEKPDCSSGVYGFYTDKCDCLKYYQCFNKKLNHFTCPYGGIWTSNSSDPACLQIFNPYKDCGRRWYRPRAFQPRFINIKFVVRNSTGAEPVDLLSFSGIVLRQPLYNIMLDFAGSRTDFAFQTTFHAVFWRSLKCINDICGQWIPDKTYWTIKRNGVTIPVGISSLIPSNDDVILFDFVTFTVHGG